MHEFYFKEMRGQELERAIEKSFVILAKGCLETDADLVEFLEREQVVRDPLDTLQYKVFITDSLIVLKSHHSMCDGIATLVMTSSFAADSYSPDKFQRLVPKMTFL